MGERYGDAVVFRGWDGGEYGRLDPGVAGRAEKQMFTGSNVLLYRSGLLGPRPGLKALSFTSPPDGAPLGAGTFATAGSVWVLTQTGSGYEVREWDLTGGTVGSAYTGTYPASVPFCTKTESADGGSSWLNIPGAGVYILNHTANTIAVTDTDPAGFVMSVYGLRSIANNGARLWYSDPNDANTFGALSYVDVSGFSISFTAPFRDGLIIGTAGGIFHMLTGVLGATTTVRELSRGGAPISPFHALRVADDKIWYYNNDDPYPGMFNGAIHDRYDYLDDSNIDTFSGKIPTRNIVPCTWAGTNDWFTYGLEEGQAYLNGVLTKHTFGGLTGAGFGAATDLGTHHLLLDSNGTGDPLDAYYFAPGVNDRPAFVGDDYAQPGDGSDSPLSAYFTTPEWWEDQGHEVKVQQVIVDYVAWDTGTTETAYFDVTVDMLHRFGSSGVTAGTEVVGLDEAVTSFSTGGTSGRATVGVSEGYGAGFQVTIDNIASCAIRNVIVVLSPETRRP